MNCNQFLSELDAAVEHRQRLSETDIHLADHAGSCQQADCATRWTDAEFLEEVIPVWRDAVPPVELTDRVLAALRPQRGPQSIVSVRGSSRTPQPAHVDHQSSGGLMAVVTAAAACLLVGTLLSLGSLNGTQTAGKVSATSHPLSSLPARVVQTQTTTTAAPQRRSYVAFAQNATEVVTDTLVLVVPAGLSNADDEDDPSHTSAWVDTWERRLEPLGRELSSALHAVLEVVPKSPMTST